MYICFTFIYLSLFHKKKKKEKEKEKKKEEEEKIIPKSWVFVKIKKNPTLKQLHLWKSIPQSHRSIRKFLQKRRSKKIQMGSP